MNKSLYDKLKFLEDLPSEDLNEDIREKETVIKALNEVLNSLSEEEKVARNNRLREIAISIGKREEVQLSFWQWLKNLLS